MSRFKRGQTWIRCKPFGPGAVCVWISLGDGVMLCLREDGTHFTTTDRGFRLPKLFRQDVAEPTVYTVKRIA